MKIAVISDIHANYQALEAVMKDIKQEHCDNIFCLGDLAMAGPQPGLVIDFVRKQTDWTVIQGNTDKLIAEYTEQTYEDVKKMYPMMANALKDDVKILPADKKEYLKTLPPQTELEIEGVKVLLVHGSPRKNNENIFPDMPVNEVEEMIKDTDADLIFCGHTHQPCGYQTSTKQTVVNVGSVGRPMTEVPDACYVIADFNNGGFSINHKFVDYDRKMAAEIVLARGYEGADKIAGLLLNPTERHV